MIHVAPFGWQSSTNIFAYLNFGLCQGLCRIAVPLFFIFNGFFLYRKTPIDKFSLEPTKKYLLHIFRLYLLWNLIYFPLNLMSILKNSKGIIYGFVKYIKNITCVGYYHLWYLNALLFAVALISFLLYKKWSPKKILFTSSIFYIIGLLGDGYYRVISPLFDVPYIGDTLNLYFKIFSTTRNGLFFAFFFWHWECFYQATQFQ